MNAFGKAATATVVGLLLTASTSYAQERLTYGSTALSSVHYTYAVSAAQAINDNTDALDVTVVATGGAVENLQRLARDQIDFGLGTYATIYQAYAGLGDFEGNAMPNLRALWVHSPSTQAWVVREDSGVTKLSELAGRPFTPGQRGSATEQLVMQMLDTLGIKPDYQLLALSDATDAVRDNRTIGYVKAGGRGTLDGTTMEIAASIPLRLLSFTRDEVASIQEKLPFVSFETYEAGEVSGYPGFTAPVQVIGEFTTAEAMTNEQVFEMLSLIMDHTDVQIAAFPSFGKLDPVADSVALVNIPLHAGAVKFYRSRGVEVPENLIPPEME
ncbi:TAXI family TRAP transporter solute-binding subunit [Nitratireductor indicus]|uniref:TRAP transporter solute receptor n=1 Tax=Nitratireductor indicus C115 TaxID=1231190 RepID=K2N6X8_9HYPH|nr:TAXI family TRAP transporter solute-binding subunit [Nitratireductor indicus]EKF43233.1 TRAP transporter solute receptor [Nitratireductor indicus C115]MDS1137786.1 TAXI family TRAP transporter solute-binding subunit [Nitratireductor indicus]SFQ53921.1 hypothetical protein SAMN05216176_105268 [Nitratireductor indicus]